MIFDVLENADAYTPLCGLFAEAFAFLRRDDLAELPDGEIAINGDKLFAVIVRTEGRSVETAKLEAHDEYIDIQYVVKGIEQMGWKSRNSLESDAVRPPEHSDVLFYEDAPHSFATVTDGHFAVFFPHDAHMPLIGDGAIHKVIIKVAVS